MTPSDLRLIRSTFDAVARDPAALATAFRHRLEELDPGLAKHLPRVEGGTSALLGSLVDGLDLAGSRAAKAQAARLRHRWPDLPPHRYGTIGQALLDALSACLGSGFRDDARAAWAAAIIMLAEDLMARSYNPLGRAA